MNSAVQTQEKELWKLLFETSEAVRNYYERGRLKGEHRELTLSQLRVMSCIFLSDSCGMRVKDISRELGITPGGVSQTVESLVQTGFLIRRQDEKDRRAVVITFSEYGEQVRRDVYAAFTELFAGFMQGISPEKQTVFREVLEMILKNTRNSGRKKQKKN